VGEPGNSDRDASPTVQLTDLTQTSGYYLVGDGFGVTVSGPPGQAITVVQNGAPGVGRARYTSAQGTWTSDGLWTSGNVGAYTQTWYVGASPRVRVWRSRSGPLPTSELGQFDFLREIHQLPGGRPNTLFRRPARRGARRPGPLSKQSYSGAVTNSTTTLGQIGGSGSFSFRARGEAEISACGRTQFSRARYSHRGLLFRFPNVSCTTQ